MNTIIGELGKLQKFIDLSKQIEKEKSPISISGLTSVGMTEIISGINGDLTLGISIIVLWIIMSITRQFIEPRIVSRKYWNTSNIYNYSYVYRF